MHEPHSGTLLCPRGPGAGPPSRLLPLLRLPGETNTTRTRKVTRCPRTAQTTRCAGSMRRSTSPQTLGTRPKGNNVDDSEPDANRANHEPATQRYRAAQHACLTPCKRAQIPSSLSTRVPLGRSPPSATGSTRRQNLLSVDASALKG